MAKGRPEQKQRTCPDCRGPMWRAVICAACNESVCLWCFEEVHAEATHKTLRGA